MANTSSAKKAARQALRRAEVNKTRKSRFRTYLRKVEEAIASGDAGAAQAALNSRGSVGCSPVIRRRGIEPRRKTKKPPQPSGWAVTPIALAGFVTRPQAEAQIGATAI